MEKLLGKYADKLVAQGLCDPGEPIFGGLDAELVWNRDDERCAVLRDVVTGLNINSILFARPAPLTPLKGRTGRRTPLDQRPLILINMNPNRIA